MYIVLNAGETSSPVGIITWIPPKTVLHVHGPWWLRGQPIGWAQVQANSSYEHVGGMQCRQDNGLLWILPPDGSFDYGISWIRGGWYLIMKSQFLWSKWCYIYIHTYTGGRDLGVAEFLFTYFYSLSSSSHRMIYRSLERHFYVEYNAFEIVGTGSVFIEIFMY